MTISSKNYDIHILKDGYYSLDNHLKSISLISNSKTDLFLNDMLDFFDNMDYLYE